MYIEQIGTRDLYGDGIGRVDLWDFSRANENEESRIAAVATVASICYGKPPKDAKKLVERLWTESGGLLSSAFEFIRAGEIPGIEYSLRNYDLATDGVIDGWFPRDTPYTRQEEHKERIATFKIEVPIFIARQIMRHRAFSFQERSRRFTEDNLEFWIQQWSTGKDLYATTKLDIAATRGKLEYAALIDAGIPKEVARAVLPQSLYTEFWMMGEIEGLRNYFWLRTDKHTQKEHRELAEAMLDLLKAHQPVLYEKVRPQGGK